MANFNLDFDWHKIGYEGKWATGINLNGQRIWNEETTPTRLSNLKTHLPFTDWGTFTAINFDGTTTWQENTKATYDYARNQYWNFHDSSLQGNGESRYAESLSANPRNSSVMLNYLPDDDRKAFGLATGAPARKWTQNFGYMLDNFERPTAKASYTNGGLGANYTLSFWLYWGANNDRSSDSHFSFLQCGDDQNMRDASGDRRDGIYSGGANYDNWCHKFEINLKASTQKLSFFFESKGGQTEFASGRKSYWGINIPKEDCPPRTWTKCSVMVAGDKVTGLSFGKMLNNDNTLLPDLKNFYWYDGPWSIGTFESSLGPAKRLTNASASNRLQQEYATIAGPDLRVSQFRGYNQAWVAGSQIDIHLFNHRNYWGDLPSNWTYPAPPAEQSIQTYDESNSIGESSTIDTEYINHLRNGLNRNLSENDAKHWIEDFDASHDTKYSVNFLSAADQFDMEQEKFNSINSMDLRDFRKIKGVID